MLFLFSVLFFFSLDREKMSRLNGLIIIDAFWADFFVFCLLLYF
jgi:hypothetical protein